MRRQCSPTERDLEGLAGSGWWPISMAGWFRPTPGTVAGQGGLFNDILVFDQMACSSPHVLYVVGHEDIHRPAVERL